MINDEFVNYRKLSVNFISLNIYFLTLCSISKNLKILNSTDKLSTSVEKFLEKLKIVLICENGQAI